MSKKTQSTKISDQIHLVGVNTTKPGFFLEIASKDLNKSQLLKSEDATKRKEERLEIQEMYRGLITALFTSISKNEDPTCKFLLMKESNNGKGKGVDPPFEALQSFDGKKDDTWLILLLVEDKLWLMAQRITIIKGKKVTMLNAFPVATEEDAKAIKQYRCLVHDTKSTSSNQRLPTDPDAPWEQGFDTGSQDEKDNADEDDDDNEESDEDDDEDDDEEDEDEEEQEKEQDDDDTAMIVDDSECETTPSSPPPKESKYDTPSQPSIPVPTSDGNDDDDDEDTMDTKTQESTPEQPPSTTSDDAAMAVDNDVKDQDGDVDKQEEEEEEDEDDDEDEDDEEEEDEQVKLPPQDKVLQIPHNDGELFLTVVGPHSDRSITGTSKILRSAFTRASGGDVSTGDGSTDEVMDHIKQYTSKMEDGKVVGYKKGPNGQFYVIPTFERKNKKIDETDLDVLANISNQQHESILFVVFGSPENKLYIPLVVGPKKKTLTAIEIPKKHRESFQPCVVVCTDVRGEPQFVPHDEWQQTIAERKVTKKRKSSGKSKNKNKSKKRRKGLNGKFQDLSADDDDDDDYYGYQEVDDFLVPNSDDEGFIEDGDQVRYDSDVSDGERERQERRRKVAYQQFDNQEETNNLLSPNVHLQNQTEHVDTLTSIVAMKALHDIGKAAGIPVNFSADYSNFGHVACNYLERQLRRYSRDNR